VIKSNSFSRVFKDTVWGKLAVMLSVIFFLYLGDAIISDWIPVYMQETLGGSLWMGLMMSFSSLVGFAADLVLPQLFAKVAERRMVMLAISSVLMTAGVFLWTTHFPLVALFLLGMGIWGLYYEFLGFGMSSYVARIAPVTDRSGVWSVVGVISSIAYCIGPLIGSWLFLWKGNLMIIFVYASLALVAYVVWLAVGFRAKKEVEVENKVVERFDIVEEIGYWRVLFGHVWPILLVSYLLGIVDATFWTTGVVLSDSLLKNGLLGGLFLPAYTLPAIFLGFVVVRMGVYKGKKKMAEKFLLMAGLFMAGLGLISSTLAMVLLALLIGAMTAVAWPLVNAVYSDILTRMGKEQKHMMGMASSMVNLSYITGPVIAGLLANTLGEKMTMMWVGIFVSFIALILLFVTPKKLKLPQAEMAEWKD
jgi:MFS family permease